MNETDPVADALARWLDARDRGERIDPEDVLRAHPEIADQLRARFVAMDMVDRAFAEQRLSAGGIPKRIGEYEILREVGRGGMGVVYEAAQASMGRRVALKVLSPAFAGSTQAVERFRREARAAGRLHHTNLVPVYALGSSAGSWFYAMELVDGPSLAEVIRDLRDGGPAAKRLGDPGTAAFYRAVALAFAGIAEALHLAHGERVIHRDVKPSNLLFDRHGMLKLMDFGLARVVGDGPTMTISGSVLGTPYYMSPEQAAARRMPIDHRTDIYSLGATLYETLALRVPFPEQDLPRLCSHIVSKEPPRPRSIDPHVPRDLETIVLKAMEKVRRQRYATAKDLAEDLRSFADAGVIRARRVGPVGRAWRTVRRHRSVSILASALIVAAAAGVFLGLRSADERRRLVDLQYAALCVQAEQAAIRDFARDVGHERSRGFYERAIALAPDRYEAYLSRSLRPNRKAGNRLADIEAAAARGAPERVIRIARATLFEALGDHVKAAQERALAGELASDDVRALLFEADAVARSGDRERAARLLDDAVARASVGSAVHHFALWSRYLLREQAREYTKALADLHGLEAQGNGGVDVQLRIASLWRRLGNEAEAQSRFEHLRRAAHTEAARHDLCVACDACDEADWLEMAALDALAAEPADAVTFLICAAHAYSERERYPEALQRCDEALLRDPASHDAHEARGFVLSKMKRWPEAHEAVKRALETDPSCPLAHANSAMSLLRLGRFEEALKAADKAIEIDPYCTAAHAQRAEALRKLKRLDDALHAITAALKLDPDNGQSHNERGLILDWMDRHEESFAAFDRAIALGDYRGHQNKGHYLLLQGRNQEALGEYTRLRELMPDSPQGHNGVAAALIGMGRYAEAEAPCRRAIETDGSFVAARHNFAVILFNLGRWDELLPAADAALAQPGETGQPRAEVCVFRGRALGIRGDREGAVAAFLQGIEASPDYHAAHCNLATELWGIGKREEALAECRRAIELTAPCLACRPNLAKFLYDLERWDEVLPAAEAALALTGLGVNARITLHWYRGDALDGLGDHAAAARAYHVGIELGCTKPELYWNAAMAAYEGGAAADALSLLDRGLDAGVESAAMHALKAYVLMKSGTLPRAREAAERALALDPGEKDALRIRPLVLRQLKLDADAAKAFEDALGRIGNDAQLLRSYAVFLLWCDDPRLRNAGRAVELAKRAANLAPSDGAYWNTLGVALCRTGEWAEALKVLDRSMSLRNGGDASDWFFVAIAHWGLGDREKARSCYRQAVEWTGQHAADNDDLRRYREEAAALIDAAQSNAADGKR